MFNIKTTNIKVILTSFFLLIFICTGINNIAYSNTPTTQQIISNSITVAKEQLHNIGDTKPIAIINAHILTLKKTAEGYTILASNSEINALGLLCYHLVNASIIALGITVVIAIITAAIGLELVGVGVTVSFVILQFLAQLTNYSIVILAGFVANYTCYGKLPSEDGNSNKNHWGNMPKQGDGIPV